MPTEDQIREAQNWLLVNGMEMSDISDKYVLIFITSMPLPVTIFDIEKIEENILADFVCYNRALIFKWKDYKER